ncbi:rab9 effector protein with kelch motifs-like isoform X3 [Anneissia japonica]|nr:rab9 effector protein with kelch motifs-like isoform X3 [Anneissia japonica]
MVNDTIYMFGGSRGLDHPTKKTSYFSDMFRLSVGKQPEWVEVTQGGDIPEARDGLTLCAVGSELFLFGGKNHPNAKQCLPGVYKCDTSNHHWVKCKTNGPEPVTLSHDTAVVRENLYVIGGIREGQATNRVHLFQTATSTWTLLQTQGIILTPRCDHRCAAVDLKIYVFGGCRGYQKCLNDVYILDTDCLVWSKPEVKGDVPCVRGSHSLTAHSSKYLYIFGGLSVAGTSDIVLDDLYKLNLDTLTWKKPFFTHVSPAKRFNHSATIYKNHLYIMYGTNENEDLFDVSIARLINPSHRKPLTLPPDEVHSLLRKEKKRERQKLF